MNAQAFSSIDRATIILREHLTCNPGGSRGEIVRYVASVAQCHTSTAEKALCEAVREGFIAQKGKAGHFQYFWDDNAEAVDSAPQVVKQVKADQAPRIVSGAKCPNGIAWMMAYGSGAIA